MKQFFAKIPFDFLIKNNKVKYTLFQLMHSK